MKNSLLSFLAGAALLLVLAGNPFTAAAQAADGVELKPGVVEDRVAPGDTYQFSLRVKNLFSTPQVFYISTEDIQGLSEDGQPIFAPAGQATGYELSKWISTEHDSITLQPNETQSVSFIVKVPKEAAPGSHFGGVFFSVRATKTSTTGTGVGIQVGSVVSLRIAGEITEEARLREFSTERLVYGLPNVTFKVRVEDMGNILLRPHGTIEVTDMRGKQVATVRVNDTAAPIFPGTDRIYRPQWSSEGFAIGRYQALLSLVYGEDGRKTISSVTSFWVLPIKPILIILGVLLVGVVGLYVVIRIYVRRKLREMGVNPTKADSAYYERKYNKSASRMMVMFTALILFVVVCLAVLFLMIA